MRVNLRLKDKEALQVNDNEKKSQNKGDSLCHGNCTDTSSFQWKVQGEELLNAHDDQQAGWPLWREGSKEE